MSWIQTFKGHRVYPLSPERTGNVWDIEDIAHALSNTCRFTGHVNRFYSVAEHSVRCAELVRPELRLHALLHDAAEAYLTDVPRPLKKQLWIVEWMNTEYCSTSTPMATLSFKEAEDRILAQIFEKFGLELPLPPEVKWADETMLLTEARDLMGHGTEDWEVSSGAKPLYENVVPMTPEAACAAFLSTFNAHSV